jgi:hypothetical protein
LHHERVHGIARRRSGRRHTEIDLSSGRLSLTVKPRDGVARRDNQLTPVLRVTVIGVIPPQTSRTITEPFMMN